jgi:twitching motility protein PilT
MSKASHQVFKRIILHNKILSEEEADALLAEVDDPEQAIERLVEKKALSAKKAEQFLAVYRKQLDKLFADQLDSFLDEDVPAEPEEEAPPEPAEPEATKMPEEAAEEPAKPKTEAELERQPEPEPSVEVSGEIKPLPEVGVELIHCLLQDAREAGASDLHVKADMVPVIRINATLNPLPRPRLSVDACEQSLLAILNEEQREHFLSTNDLDFSYDGGDGLGRYRTNYLREHRGVDAIFRPIPEKVPSFEELDLPERVKRFTDYRVGVVLVTGPKGSGKTTTLAAMVDAINSTRAEHIITVEDPIEFVQPCKEGHVNQRQVGVHTKSFSNALRSALREAPDVIMVGEMRDLETTSLAITAAETGHLVLATLHTPDAIRTIGRVLDVFPPKEQPQIRAMLSESLRGIVSQLLLPSADNTGMVLALEILVNTQAIGHLIREEKVHQIRGLMQTGKQHGMVLMDESLVRLAKEGRISKEVVMSRAEDLKMVQRELAEL